MPQGEGIGYTGLTLREWIAALASSQPVPAGASLAAASAAGAAALAAKIAGIAVRKGGEVGPDAPARLQSLAGRLLECADEDVAAYRAWRKHRDDRSAARMIQVPAEIERLCLSATEAARGLRQGLDASVLEDVHVAVAILETCARAAGGIAAANRRSIGAAT